MDNPSLTSTFTVAQVMERLHIGRDTVYKAIREGRLPARKLGKRTLIVASDLEKFLKSTAHLGRRSRVNFSTNTVSRCPAKQMPGRVGTRTRQKAIKRL